MRKYALSIIAMILLVAGLDTVSPAEEALQSTMADLEKGWQNLDTASLEKTRQDPGRDGARMANSLPGCYSSFYEKNRTMPI